MFYGQCNRCGERWGLGTTPTCVCPNELVTVTPPQDRVRTDPVTGDVSIGTPPTPEWVGLTDEEFDFLVPYCENKWDLADYKTFARDIEAKLKEKNT